MGIGIMIVTFVLHAKKEADRKPWQLPGNCLELQQS